MKVTVKYIGDKPRVVNGQTWIPGETWDIDDRILANSNLEGLVTIQSVPAAPKATSQQASSGSETPSDAGKGTDEVVLHRSTVPGAPATAQTPAKKVATKKD